jgi:hypothetical protein
MKRKSKTATATDKLRRLAEARLRKQGKSHQSKDQATKLASGPQRLLHELQVHQVELEMQNTELQEAQDRMEATVEKYTDLSEAAPVRGPTGAGAKAAGTSLRGSSSLRREATRRRGRSMPPSPLSRRLETSSER